VLLRLRGIEESAQALEPPVYVMEAIVEVTYQVAVLYMSQKLFIAQIGQHMRAIVDPFAFQPKNTL
jgi:hypothetical protein